VSKIKGIHVVYANWCPHCVPTTVGPVADAGKRLGIPVRLYDIDTDDEAKADELVKKYGDWTPDYTIPQVFVEMDDGEIKHVLTGRREGLAFTGKAVEELVKSDFDSGSPTPSRR
jgi:glutaredoxin